MTFRTLTVFCLAGLLAATIAPAQAEERGAPLPATMATPTWLGTHQRLCFGVDGVTLAEVIDAGSNVICGGTNAAGIGFAGGPFILGREGEVVDIMTGLPIPAQTLAELRSRVDAAHARGVKVLGEVIRFNMTPWIQADHPEWQEINSPGGKPITVAELKDLHVLGCWNSPYGDWFIKSQVELVKQLDWDGYNMDGFGCWAHVSARRALRPMPRTAATRSPPCGMSTRRNTGTISNGDSLATPASWRGGLRPSRP